MTLTKICGITNIDDALAAADFGADYIGFVFAESPRRVDTRTVSEIMRALGGRAKTVGVFVDESGDVLRIMDE
ncbi:N-(5'-phosphoribosyl)anthranilate isomerase, partial [bacterium]|nr:N-(5'-phosphoribosyl)anthranilate isomerase [bacterium]